MSKHARGSRFGRIADTVVSFLSAEWILNWTPYTANGGTVVAARAAWLTAWIYVPAFLLRTTFPTEEVIDARDAASVFTETLPWLAAIFAGVYAGLYSRFASQWNYLAELYNQIVETQIELPSDYLSDRLRILAAWKAGFIEDAEELHLATKPLFLVAIRQWAANPLVAEEYSRNTVGGDERLTALLLRLELIWVAADDARRNKAAAVTARLGTGA